MSKKLICVVSGKTTTVTDEYYDKRVSDFQTEENLKQLYVCRAVKNLLKRGYSQTEIRDNLKIESASIPESQIKDILALEEDVGEFSTQKSDPEVAAFIERLKL